MQRHYRVTVDGRTYDVTVEDAAAPGPAVTAAALPDAAPAGLPDTAPAAAPRAAAKPAPGSPTAAGATVVAAPLPGVVLELRAGPGQRVAAGEVLLILEAMKMENEITAPVAGLVERVAVATGATVDLGAELVVLRP